MLAGALVPASAAASWTAAGGGAGRAGRELATSGSAPFTALWTAPDAGVATPAILTEGSEPRVAYETRDGRLHLRDALSGAPVGDASGVGLGTTGAEQEATGFGGAVAPVSSSRNGEPGQLFAVVNDPSADGDLLVVQVDETSGAIVQERRIAGSSGQRVSSAPLLTGDDASGARSLVFTSVSAASWETQAVTAEVWRLQVAGAQQTTASFGDAERGSRATDVATLNPLAAPTLLTLGGRASVVVAGGSATTPVLAFAADGFCADGPACRAPQLGPTAPRFAADGTADRQVFAFGASAPADGGPLLVPFYDERTDKTVVVRYAASPGGGTLTEAARSAPIAGRPGAGLATTITDATGAGKVVLATGRDLAALDGVTLKTAWRLGGTAGLAPGTTGFGATAPAIGDGTVFAVRDDGERVGVLLADGTPVSPDQLDADTGSAGVTAGIGGPAIGPQGIVVFATDAGVTALRDRCGDPVATTAGADRFKGTPAGDRVRGGSGDDLLEGAAGDDCLYGGADADRVAGGDGDDRLDGGSGDDRLNGGAGADGLTGDAGDDSLSGGDGTDTLDGGSGTDVARGGTGADVLTGGPGSDRLFGDAAGDGLAGGAGNDLLDGGTGADRLRGGSGHDVLYGRAGNDKLYAGPGGDKLFGGTGDDQLDAVNGAVDVIDCGPGFDTLRADPHDRTRRCEKVTRVRR